VSITLASLSLRATALYFALWRKGAARAGESFDLTDVAAETVNELIAGGFLMPTTGLRFYRLLRRDDPEVAAHILAVPN